MHENTATVWSSPITLENLALRVRPQPKFDILTTLIARLHPAILSSDRGPHQSSHHRPYKKASWGSSTTTRTTNTTYLSRQQQLRCYHTTRIAKLNMASINLHLRSELGKALEHRSALTPATTKKLVEAGYRINVERSPQRIFDDEDFEKAGATLVEENTWRNAPKDTIIIGLKELPVEECE